MRRTRSRLSPRHFEDIESADDIDHRSAQGIGGASGHLQACQVQDMGNSIFRNGAIQVSVFRNVALNEVNLFELTLPQDGAKALEAGINVKNTGRATAFHERLGNPRADETLRPGNQIALRLCRVSGRRVGLGHGREL